MAETVKTEDSVATAIEGVTFQQLLDSYADSRVSEATITATKNERKRLGFDENGNPIKKEESKKIETNSDEPAWFTAFKEQQKLETEELKQKVTGFEKEKTQSQLMGKLTSKLKEKGVSEKFYKGRNLNIESEDSIEQLANEIETDWNEFVQEKAEQGVVINIPQSSSGNVKEGTFGAKIAELENAGGAGGVEAKKLI